MVPVLLQGSLPSRMFLPQRELWLDLPNLLPSYLDLRLTVLPRPRCCWPTFPDSVLIRLPKLRLSYSRPRLPMPSLVSSELQETLDLPACADLQDVLLSKYIMSIYSCTKILYLGGVFC